MTRDFFTSLDAETNRRMLDRSPDLVYAVDVATRTIRDCNATFAERLGYAEPDDIEMPEVEIYAERDHDELDRVYEALDDGDSVDGVYLRAVTEDGSPLDVSLNATLLEVDGEAVCFCFLRDISSLKETERELREHTERLEQSNEALEQFAYLASHDLQEPLRMVASYTELLERKYRDELDDKAKKYIDYAVEGAERMKALINDLLDYSRVGRPDGEFDVVDLEEVAEAVTDNLQIRIRESDADVQWEELPEVRGDMTQLVQVVQNLVENALKFAGDDPPEVTISAERTREGDIRVAVADNGIGFDTDHSDRIFQIFQRLHERGEYEGTGTGLAIVKKVVDLHGGDLEVDSEPGVGTEISFTLPPPEDGEGT